MPQSNPVILIAFGEYDHLGAGYLSSVLRGEGFETRMIDFRYESEEILFNLRRHNPLVVGFSVIFDSYISEFAALASVLRKGGISCHFTAGGYYASLHPDELFNLIAELDSIVRFEGEDTFLELVKNLNEGGDWTQLQSLAYRQNGKIVKTPLRPLEKDLDRFPFPARRPLMNYVAGRKFATIIAGRGCVHDCSFCNTREFYMTPGGPQKRIRKARLVVSEIEHLYKEKGCTVFLFQDDDFPVKAAGGNEWITSFCNELEKIDLYDKILWKINCRPDEISENLFAMLKKHGLFLVFIGIEDGTDDGLKRLNKKLTVKETLRGIKILKDLGIGFDYGFMLFQPDTTFLSLRENLDFLRKICTDGYTPVTFLKLMPNFDTRVEKELREQGRLKESAGYLDYDFNTQSLNDLYITVMMCFGHWIIDAHGLANISKWARNFFQVHAHSCTLDHNIIEMNNRFRKIVTDSNNYLLDTLCELTTYFETEEYLKNGKEYLDNLGSEIVMHHDQWCTEVKECML
ncbi:MAG: B12-binding domain-containing radical SAM protein [Bacteroidales bacterium]|jgi:radical SAM superfamily enzyme YgiQ (UPF0313 family)|nr:B12-binding domain-containing radical SAM protein [Bacteroidales bacterium]